MKRSYINLRHHDHIYIVKPTLRNSFKPSILCLIPPQSASSVFSYLRLAEIVSLYYSLRLNHKHQEFKRLILNYLIITNRKYSKWQQKQFLDILIRQAVQKKQSRNYYSKNYNFYNKTHHNQNGKIFVEHENTLQNKEADYKSKMSKFKQSIVYDVDRTYFRRNNIQKKKSKQNKLQRCDLNHQSKLAIQKQISKKVNPLYENDEAFPYFITLSTQIPFKSQASDNFGPILGYSQTQYGSSYQQSSQSCSRVQYNTLQHMQNYLKNVLIKISHKYPTIGYIQGFNYIAKNMYLTGFEEQEAFKYLSYFVEQRNLGRIILNNMSGIKRLSYVLKVYIFNYVPKVYKHLLKSQVEPQIFCTSWFITLFSQDLSVQIVNKLWHLFALEGWKIFIQFGVAFLCTYQQQILLKDLDQIFTFMRRILQKFIQQIKRKNRRNGSRIWQKNLKKEQIVWRLMSSVQVNGNIVNQLCRQMLNLQNDSQIQIWRIQQGQNLYFPRSEGTSSEKSINSSGIYNRQRSMSYLNNIYGGFGSQICCDRVPNVDPNQISINIYRPHNMFSLCHNMDTCVE